MEQHPVPSCSKTKDAWTFFLLKPPAPNYTGPGAVQMLLNGLLKSRKRIHQHLQVGYRVYTKNNMVREKKNPKFMPCSITSDAIPQVLPLFWHQDNFREEEVKLTTFCFLYVPQLDKSRDWRQFEKVHTSTKEINFHSPDCLWLYSSEWYEKSLGEVIARPLQLKTHK